MFPNCFSFPPVHYKLFRIIVFHQALQGVYASIYPLFYKSLVFYLSITYVNGVSRIVSKLYYLAINAYFNSE